MTQLNLICLKNSDYTGIPFFEIDDFQDQLRGNFTKRQVNLIYNDLKYAGLI